MHGRYSLAGSASPLVSPLRSFLGPLLRHTLLQELRYVLLLLRALQRPCVWIVHAIGPVAARRLLMGGDYSSVRTARGQSQLASVSTGPIDARCPAKPSCKHN